MQHFNLELGRIRCEQLFVDMFKLVMWETFKVQLVKIRERYVPLRRRDKDSKARGHFKAKEVVNWANKSNQKKIGPINDK